MFFSRFVSFTLLLTGAAAFTRTSPNQPLVSIRGWTQSQYTTNKSHQDRNNQIAYNRVLLFGIMRKTNSVQLSAGATDGDDPVKLIISGAPASGKGTQCEVIKEKFGVVHLSTGDMLRAAVAAQTPVGKKAKDFMDSGKLVPDEVIIGVVSSNYESIFDEIIVVGKLFSHVGAFHLPFHLLFRSKIVWENRTVWRMVGYWMGFLVHRHKPKLWKMLASKPIALFS